MKKLKIILLLLFFTSCSNIPKKELSWQKSKSNLFYINNLKPGDILIKKKVWYSPISWFGHSAVMVSNSEIGEYPKIGKNYIQTNIMDWLYDNKKIVILRYKFFDEKFKKQFIKNLKKYKTNMYKITFNKYDDTYFYCSKYVWYIYYKTAKDTNYPLNFRADKRKYFILPYDLIYSKQFEIIKLNQN